MEKNLEQVSANSVEEQFSTEIQDGDSASKLTNWAPNDKTNVTEGLTKGIVRELTERWMLVSDFSWKTTHVLGTELKKVNLMKDIMKNISPNIVPLQPYAYFKCNVHLKVQINASRFYCGQVLVDWTYHPEAFASCTTSFDNIFLRTQRPNVVYQVGSETVCNIYVPFVSIYNYVGRAGSFNDTNFAVATVSVLSELRAPDAMPQEVHGTILYRLEDVQVHGLVGIAQMFSLGNLLKGAEAVLHTINADDNRDRPTNTARLPVIPQGSSSWCVGSKDVDNCNVLRLFANATTPFMDRQSKEFNLEYIKSKFALFSVLRWDTNSSELAVWDVRPLSRNMRTQLKNEDTSNNLLATYAVPPISVYASAFALWRGNLELLINVVCTPYHSGRLLISFCPGAKLKRIEPQVLTQQYYKIVDIQDQASTTFEIPYVYATKWCRTSVNSGRNVAEGPLTGHVYVYALNNLSCGSGVVQYVDVMCYVRGGYNFEVAAPIEPIYAMGIDRSYVDENLPPLRLEGTRIFMGNWRFVEGNKKYVLRTSNTSDQVVRGTCSLHCVYYVSKGIPTVIMGNKSMCKYIVPVKIPNDNAIYFSAFATKTQAFSYIKTYDPHTKIYNNDLLIPYESDGDWYDYTGSRPILVVPTAEAQVNVALDKEISMESFSETIKDLKDICRRYQFYYQATITLKPDVSSGRIVVKLPIVPGGLPLITKGSDIGRLLNVAREGIIPLLSSGFRFFRGSLRFKVVVHCDSDIIMRVTHINDVDDIPVHPVLDTDSLVPDYASSGYASFAQSTRVNQILEVEVPYYKRYERIINQKCLPPNDLTERSHLGYLSFALLNDVDKQQQLSLQVFYALGDDARFQSFMGYPEMIDRVDLPFNYRVKYVADAQMMNMFADKKELTHTIASVGKAANTIEAGVTESVAELHKISENIAVVSRGLVGTTEALTNTVNTIEQALTKTIDRLLGNESPGNELDMSFQHILSVYIADRSITVERALDVMWQILQVINNPSKGTIVIAATAILVKCGIVLLSDATMVKRVITIMLEFYFKQNSNNEQFENKQKNQQVIAEAQSLDQDALITAISTMVALISNAFSIKCTLSSDAKNKFAKVVASTLSEVPRNSNIILTFLKHNYQLFCDLTEWLFQINNPKQSLMIEFLNHHEYLAKWAERMEALLVEPERSRVKQDFTKLKEVFAGQIIARNLMLKINFTEGADPRVSYIRDLNIRLNKFCDELHADCLAVSNKYEPFVVYMDGKPGIGKSTVLEPLGIELLKGINFVHNGPPVYVRQPTTAFWNNVQQQPILVYDDFGCSTNILESQIEELFAIKSTTPFNPNIAELENKKLIYNPKVVMIASNIAFPSCNTLTSPEAFWRRRDILCRCELDERLIEKGITRVDHMFMREQEVLAIYTEFNSLQEILDNNAHLRFSVAFDSSKRDSKFSELMNYKEFVECICLRFKAYDKLERQKFLKRLERQSEFVGDDGGISSEMLAKLIEQDDSFSELRGSNRDFYKYKLEAQMMNSHHFQVFEKLYMRMLKEAIPLNCLHGKIEESWIPVCVGEEEPILLMHREQLELHDNDEPAKWAEERLNMLKDGRAILATKACGPDCCFGNPKAAAYYFSYLLSMSVPHILSIPKLGLKIFGVEVNKLEESKHAQLIRLFVKRMEGISDIAILQSRVEKLFSEIEACDHNLLYYAIWQNSEYGRKRLNLAEKFAVPKKWMDHLVLKLGKWFKTLSTCWLLKKVVATLIGVGSIVAGAALVYKKIKGRNHEKEDELALFEIGAQYYPSGDSDVRRSRIKRNRIKKPFVYGKAQSYEADFSSLLVNNCGKVRAGNIEQNFLATHGRNLVITKHFWEAVEKRGLEKLTFVFGKSSTSVIVDRKNITCHVMEEKALVLLHLETRCIPLFRDIRRHMATEQDLDYMLSEVQIYEYTKGNMHIIDSKAEYIEGCLIKSGDDYAEQYMQDCIRYKPNRFGMCGALCVANIVRNKIIGLHVAGGSGCGFAEPICREMFDEMPSSILDGADVHAEFIELPAEQPEALKESGLIFECAYDLSEVPRMPQKSSLIPMPTFDVFAKHTMEPSILSHLDERWTEKDTTPLFCGIKKKAKLFFDVDSEVLEQCYANFKAKILTFNPLLVRKNARLSWAEILGGIPGVMKALNKSTSEGFPLVMKRPKQFSSKEWLYEIQFAKDGRPEKVTMHEEFMKIHRENMFKRQLGIAPVLIFSDSLKDTKLPKDKVCVPGKTRVFSCCPIEFTIVWKEYFGLFQLAFHNNRYLNETAIGINADSVEFHEMIVGLLGVGDGGFVTGDYKAFGDTLHPTFLAYVIDIMIEWYKKYYPRDESGHLIRRVLKCELLNKYCLAGRYLYRTVGGIPSGFPMTVEVNSMVNSLYMRYAYVTIRKGCNLNPSLRYFNRYVRIITYGDDLIMNVHKEVRDHYNFLNIKKVLKTMNIDFDAETKDGREYSTLNVSECSFLKRKIIYFDKMFVGRLPMDVINEILQWMWKYNDPKAAICDSSRSYLQALFPYGEQHYEKARAELMCWFYKEYNEHLDCNSFLEAKYDYVEKKVESSLEMI